MYASGMVRELWQLAFPSSSIRPTASWLPEPLAKEGPFEVLWWQWIGLLLLLPIAWALCRLLSWLTLSAVGRVVKHTSAQWDDELLERQRGPVRLAWGIAAVYVLLPFLQLAPDATLAVRVAMKSGLFVVFFWALLRSVDTLRHILVMAPALKDRPAALAIVPIATSVTKVLVLGAAIVAVLAELGYPVASLIAGLGIGGLALALAAQKTIENLFGALSLGLDQPFREGDLVKVEDFVGTVESIGLRSTRLRTADRTLITIPNGRLADMRLESLTSRDRIRLACTVGLVYGTTASQMRQVLDGFESYLRSHPKIWPDAVIVRFAELGESGLKIEITVWFQTQDYSEFLLIRQDVLLQLMEIVERAGTSFAFPTRTIHLTSAERPHA